MELYIYMIFPSVYIHSVFNITPYLLNKLNIKALILDVDNTLRTNDSSTPIDGIIEWINIMKKSGFKLIIVSNNFKKSVEPFAKKLNLEYVFFGCKPLTFGLSRAEKKLKIKKDKIAMVGDQIFTDIIAGNLKGFKTMLVDPFLEEKGWSFKIRRWLEKKIISLYNNCKKGRN